MLTDFFFKDILGFNLIIFILLFVFETGSYYTAQADHIIQPRLALNLMFSYLCLLNAPPTHYVCKLIYLKVVLKI